jgi:hypothetical protein
MNIRAKVTVLAVGVALGIALTATPASGHVKGSVAHLVGHMKTAFFTKAESDARYVNVGEKAASAAQADRATSAARADTATNAENAENAEDAETLGGFGPASFLGRNETAADSTRLGGLHSSAFMRSSVYGKGITTVGRNDAGQPCVGNDACSAFVDCDFGGLGLNGGYQGVDNGTHVHEAFVISSIPGRFYLAWKNNATVDEITIRIGCVAFV